MKTVFMQPDAVRRGELILVRQGCPLYKEPEGENLSNAVPPVKITNEAAVQLGLILDRIKARSGIVPVSGYRSHLEQVQIYEDSLRENGPEFTRQYVALPDCSEHQTGLAVDLGEKRPDIDFIRPEFPYTGLCGMFREHAADYGFIERYPAGKESITGIAWEPWHFRYVGRIHARIMGQLGLTLEEYLEILEEYPEDGRHFFYTFTGAGGGVAEIYRKACPRGEAPVLRLPEHSPSRVSGDNRGGLVVTVWRTRD